jgi:hypothetical protein
MSWAIMESAPKDGSRVLLYARSTLDPHHKVDLLGDAGTGTYRSGKSGPSIWITPGSWSRPIGWPYHSGG